MTNMQKGIKIVAICLAIFLIITIFSWGLSILSWLTNTNITGQNEKFTFEEVYQEIKSIEIDAIDANIKISSGTEFKVQAQGMDSNFSSKVRGQKLKIEEKSNWFSKSSGTIFITIPTGITLKKLDIDTGAGKFEIIDIQAREFEMNHGAGILIIENSIFQKSEIDGGAGEIEIFSSQFQDLELDAGVGKIEIEAELTGTNKIECGVGELELILLGNKEDYSIHSEKGIGTITIAGEKQKNNITYGTGNQRIELEGGVGSIKVSFKSKNTSFDDSF